MLEVVNPIALSTSDCSQLGRSSPSKNRISYQLMGLHTLKYKYTHGFPQYVVYDIEQQQLNVSLQIQAVLQYNLDRIFEKTIQYINVHGYFQMLAIRKNWNRSILAVVPSISRNTVGNLILQIRFGDQPSYWISGIINGTTLKFIKFMPPIMAIVVPSSTLVG